MLGDTPRTRLSKMADEVSTSLSSSLFQDAFPEEWRRDPEFSQYLSELTSFTIDRLSREPGLIREEQECVLNSTQKLAFNNYNTFIQTAVCSQVVFRDFISVEQHVCKLVELVPEFVAACKQFGTESQDISTKRKLNSHALSKHTQLLEVLEIPQLMETCVRNGYYEEALELSSHVRRMEKKHSDIPIIKGIAEDVERSKELMLSQLVQQLQGSIALPACLHLVGLMRRMGVFNETQLRLKFLQARDHWLTSLLSAIPVDDSYHHISKMVEVCRVQLFDIVTQYKAIFPDDDSAFLTSLQSNRSGGQNQLLDGALFSGWLNSKIWQFLRLLEADLSRGVAGRMDSVLSQCMYFGLSFSRVGADFRPLLVPVFVKVALRSLKHTLNETREQFHASMKHFSISQPIPTLMSSFSLSSASLSPPHSLLSFPPLAHLTNGIITAVNELRTCAPLALATEMCQEVEQLLRNVVQDIIEYHKIEHTGFTAQESAAFRQFCSLVVTDLLPYIQQVTSALYKENTVQQLASRTLFAVRSTDKTEGSIPSSLNTVQSRVRVGISARALSEPLRAVVPEVFEELEKEQVRRSLEQFQSPHPPAASEKEEKEEDNVDTANTDTLSLHSHSTEHQLDTTTSIHTPTSLTPENTI